MSFSGSFSGLSRQFAIEFEAAVEAAEIHRLTGLQFEGGVRVLHGQRVGQHEPAAGLQHGGGHAEEVFHQPADIGQRNAPAHRGVGDDEGGAVGAEGVGGGKVAEVGAGKRSIDRLGAQGGEVGPGNGDDFVSFSHSHF